MKQSYLNAERRKSLPQQYKHDLGQHFLYDEALLRHLVEITGITREEDVLEIGPGEGTLTEVLCEAAGKVFSVEVDQDLIPLLHLMEERHPNLKIIEGDIRKIDFSENVRELRKPFHVIANIPYNITTPILDLLWLHRNDFSQLSLMVQKEVAQKLTAAPGDELYGLSSVTAQYYAEASIAEMVPAECFTPPPKVDSAFILLKIRKAPTIPVVDEAAFFRIVKAAFSLRRKTIPNSLKALLPGIPVAECMEAIGIKATSRAEELSVNQWITLANRLLEAKKEQTI